MNHFDQKTAKTGKPKSGSKPKFRQKPEKKEKRTSTAYYSFSSSKKGGQEGYRSGFTFSVPVLPMLATAALIIVIALAAFNWEDLHISMPEAVITLPVSETEAEMHTTNYAITGVSDLLSAATFTEPQSTVAVAVTSSAAVNEENQLISLMDTPAASASNGNDLITFEWQPYKVKKGDSVSKIAKDFGVSVGAIISSNDIKNAKALREGTNLRIPNIDGIPYLVKKGDSLSRIAASFNVPMEVILDVNDIKSDNIRQGETLFIPGARMNDIDLRLSLGELFIYPVPGRFITSHFGMRKDPISGVLAFHTGIDLRANTGTPVVAALDGRISVVSENRLYGKYIIITHDNGYKTLYAHLNSFSVKQGDRVARGRKIGESGNTGYSTGPHLHFSIYDKNNKPVNPLDLLR